MRRMVVIYVPEVVPILVRNCCRLLDSTHDVVGVAAYAEDPARYAPLKPIQVFQARSMAEFVHDRPRHVVVAAVEASPYFLVMQIGIVDPGPRLLSQRLRHCGRNS